MTKWGIQNSKFCHIVPANGTPPHHNFILDGSTVVVLEGLVLWDEDLLINGRASLETFIRVAALRNSVTITHGFNLEDKHFFIGIKIAFFSKL